MYAIVKTGGKQYRVEQGQSLLIERLPDDDGATVMLDPLLYVDGAEVVDGDDLAKVQISARVVGQERGPKLRVVKFKPKRGYKRRNGHRQELTRIEVTEIKLRSGRSRAARSGSSEPVESAEAVTPDGGAEPAAPAAGASATRRPRASAAKPSGGEPSSPRASAAKPSGGEPSSPRASAAKPSGGEPSSPEPDSTSSKETDDGA